MRALSGVRSGQPADGFQDRGAHQFPPRGNAIQSGYPGDRFGTLPQAVVHLLRQARGQHLADVMELVHAGQEIEVGFLLRRRLQRSEQHEGQEGKLPDGHHYGQNTPFRT